MDDKATISVEDAFKELLEYVEKFDPIKLLSQLSLTHLRHHGLTCPGLVRVGYVAGRGTFDTEPQRGGQVMNQCSAYVGLDVHKDTIAVAVALPGREAPVYRGEIKNQRKSLLRLIRSLSPHAEVLSFC